MKTMILWRGVSRSAVLMIQSMTNRNQQVTMKCQHVLVPVDLHDPDLRAIETAMEVASRHNARITLMRVIEAIDDGDEDEAVPQLMIASPGDGLQTAVKCRLILRTSSVDFAANKPVATETDRVHGPSVGRTHARLSKFRLCWLQKAVSSGQIRPMPKFRNDPLQKYQP